MKIFDPKLTGSIEIQSQVSGSIIPTTNETFDLGSASNRWNDIYLAGSTIDLGGTKMTKDSSGNIEFKDASNNRKKIIVEEILIGTGDNQKTLKVDNGKSMVVDKDGNVITQMAGHIMPHGHDIYDLGSPTAQWRDLYLSSGSLYIDGTQVISSTSNVLTVTTSTGQSLKLLETGADDITIQTDSGNIELKGTVEILSGKKLIDSAGTIIQFGDSLGVTGSIEVSGTVDGIDLQSMSSSLDSRISTLTGKTIISSSAQIASEISGSNTAFSASVSTRFEGLTTDYTELDNIPNNIVSSSAQIASDISGSNTAFSASVATRFEGLTTDYTELDNIPNNIVSSSAQVTAAGALMDSEVTSLSLIKSLTAAKISGSFTAPSASLASNIASLNASTSSYLQNTTDILTGNLTVTGTLTAQQFDTEIVSASILFDSGSTKFGDSSDDLHQFTGSLNVLGSITGTVNGYLPLSGGTMTGDLRFQDSRKILMGAGDMFQINHTGTLSQIATYEGDLFIDNNAADKDIIFRSDDGSGGLATYLFLDGSQTNVNFQKSAIFTDNIKALFGGSGDLQIYHNATDSVIETTTGDLYITNKTDDGDIILRSDDGAGGFTPYYRLDGGSVTNQFLKTVKLYDSSQLWIGDNNDLQIYHNGNDSYIKDLGPGDLRIVASATKIYDADMSHLQATFTDGGSVDLYYSGNKKFATTNSGINITGGGTFTTSITAAGNSNSFGNTSITGLSASTGTFSASVTAAGNTNSFGATTFTGDINLGTFNSISGVANDNLILKIDKSNLSGGSSFDIQMDGSTSAFFINNSRNIGIGTTNPVQKLQVDGSVYSNGGEFYVNNNSGITAVGNLIFKAHDGSNYFEGMRILANSNVGIGITNPTAKLHVVGDGIVSGELSFKPKHYVASDDLNSDTRNIFSTHQTNQTTSNRPINYSSVYTLGGTTYNALQISTNEDYSESGMWIRQYNQNSASPQGTGWQNWTEVWTTNHAPLTKITNWDTAYTYSQVSHLPLAGGTMNSNASINMNSGQFTSVDYIDFGIGQLNGESSSNFILKSLGDITYNVDSNNNGNSAHIFQESGAELMRIRYDGKVGIGTNSPHTQLQVGDSEQTTSAVITIASRYGGSNPYLNFRSGHPSNSNVWNMASIHGDDDGNYNGKLEFRTSNSGQAAPTIKMIIKATGKVGIGSTSPQTKLDVESKVLIGTDGTYGAGYGLVGFGGTTNGYNRIFGNTSTGDGLFLASATGKGIYFRVNGSSTDSVAVNPQGYLGIGTNAPTKPLSVAGDVILGQGQSRPVTYRSGDGNFRITPNSGGWSTGYFFDNYSGTFKGGFGMLGSGDSTTYFWIGDNYNDTTMVIQPNAGNVGIGTTTPGAKLHVSGGGFDVYTDYSTSNAAIGLSSLKKTDGMSAIVFGRFHSTNNSTALRFNYVGNNNSANYLGLGFYANDDLLVLKPSGNFGIGTTAPGAKLDIAVVPSAAWMKLTNANETAFNLTTYNNGTNNGSSSYAFKHGLYYGSTENAAVTFYRGGSSVGGFLTFTTNNGTERMRIASNGNVGIGTTNPGYPLEVQSGGVGTVLRAGTAFVSIDSVGTASAPSLVFNGDTNTGIFRAASDILAFSTAGTERMRIDPNGQIYFKSSTDYKLGFNDSNDVNQWWIKSYTSGDFAIHENNIGDKLNIKAGGNIGIGSTNPQEKLDIAGNVILNASNARLKLKGGITGTNSGIDWTFNTASTQYARIDLDYDTRASTGLLIDSGYPITLDFSSGRFAIQHNGSEKMRIDTSGNVGIGTTSPGAKLEIHKSQAYGQYGPVPSHLNLVNTHTEGTSGFLTLSAYYNNTNNTHYQVGGIGGGKETTVGDGGWGGYLSFYTTSDGTAGAASGMFEHMRITADGYVGIGTTAPQTKLHVKGAADDNEALLYIENIYSSGGVFHPAALFKHTHANHSYGTVAEFRTEGTSSDRPGVLFSNGHNSHNWSIGQGVSGANDNFAIGYRNFHPNTGNGWATPYLTINTAGAATFASSITAGGNVTINSPGDNILTLNQTSTDNKWNYVNFNNQGSREWFIGQDSGGNFDLYNDNIDSYAITVGYTDNAIDLNANTTVSGNLTVAGTLTAQEFRAELTTSTILYESGSTKFGDTSDDNHDFTGSLNVQGNVKHSGLTMTSGTDIDQLYTTTKSMTLTTNWQDTGINGTDLTTGTYVVAVYAHDHAVGGGHYYETYSGTMTWYHNDTNDTTSDEILLHKAGHHSGSRNIYLRTKRTATADTDDLKLQIAHTATCTGNSDYVFKFRRLI